MKNIPSLRGFTLVETMVAVTILALAVTGAFTAANSAFVAAEISKDQLTATYLAQEGIEYVRLLRDDAYLSTYQASGDAWGEFLGGPVSVSVAACISPHFCTFDSVSSPALQRCSSGVCGPLYLFNTGSYSYYTQNSSGATLTPFTRSIQAVAISSTEEKIVSTVSWDFHGTPYSITVTDYLTPWQ